MKRLARQKTSKPTIASLTQALQRVERERDAAVAALESPDFQQLMGFARRWHYGEVRALVDSAIEALAAHRKREAMTADSAREWLSTWVDETIDGHSHVIYRAQAGMVLAASDNDGAYEAEYGESARDTSVQAYAALQADVWELLSSRSKEWEHDDEEQSDGE